MSTAWEQLEGAALSLARSGAIKDRLAEAFRNHLALVNPEDLPAALRAAFRACHDLLTRERPLRGEDAVRATVRKMSNQDADEVACTVVRLFAAMAREAPSEAAFLVSEAVVEETLTRNGARENGTPVNGTPVNGTPVNGTHENGRSQNGVHLSGINGARPKLSVPPVIALYTPDYAAEA